MNHISLLRGRPRCYTGSPTAFEPTVVKRAAIQEYTLGAKFLPYNQYILYLTGITFLVEV